jgi:hypothetical protein
LIVPYLLIHKSIPKRVMKPFFLILLACSFGLAQRPANAQTELYTKVFYDMDGSVQVWGMTATADHCFLLAGEREDNPVVIKIDQAGEILWQKRFLSPFSRFHAIDSTRDGGFLAAGIIRNSYPDGSDMICMKLTSTGDTIWSRTINTGLDEAAFSIRETSDQGAIIAGYSKPDGNTPARFAVIKLNADGNLEWAETYTGSNSSNCARSVAQTSDGGYILTGSIAGASPYSEALFLMKLGPAGNPVWFKQQVLPSGGLYSQGLDVVVRDDGFVISAVYGYGSGCLIKTDLSANVLWGYTYPNSWSSLFYYEQPAPKLGLNSNFGYNLMVGNEFSLGIFIITDSLGINTGSKMVINTPVAVHQTSDGGNLIAGNGPIFGVGMSPTDNLQLGLIKIDSAGNSSECVFDEGIWWAPVSVVFSSPALESFSGGTITPIHPAIVSGIDLEVANSCVTVTGSLSENGKSENPLQIYPNPSNGLFNINFAQPQSPVEGLLEVYDFSGTLVHRDNIHGELPLAQSMKFLPGGLYSIRLYTGNGVYYQRIMIIHP